MENKFKRFLSLLLAFVMVLGMIPTGHIHAHAAETETVQILQKVTSVEADAQYVITFAGQSRAVANQTRSWGSGKGNGLDTGTLPSLSTVPAALYLWTLEAADDGFKIRSVREENKYVSISANNAVLGDTAQIFTFTEMDGGIVIRVKEGDQRFNNLGGENCVGGWNSDGTKFDIYKVVEGPASELDPYGKLRGQWSTYHVDTETLNGGDTEGEFWKAFDNNPGTHWHSNWKGATDKLTGNNTYTGVIDLGQAYTINRFYFTPRTDKTDTGIVTQASLYVRASEDAEWVAAAEHAAFANNNSKKVIDFPAQPVRYVKFVAEKSNDGWVTISEFDVGYDAPAECEHSYTTEEIIKEATCVDGQKKLTCTLCGDSKIETIPAIGEHTSKTVPGVAPTLDSTGLTDGAVCSVCGHTITAQETIPATYNNGIIPWDVLNVEVGEYQGGYESSYHEGGAQFIKDDDFGSLWHSYYNNGVRENHWIEFELTANYNVTELRYLPRQSGNQNGTITEYEILISHDGVNYVSVKTGTWEENTNWKVAQFDAHNAKYVRLVSVDSISTEAGKIFTSAAEIRLVGEATDHEHTFTTTTVDATCTTDGSTTIICECGDTHTFVLPATGNHTEAAAVKENEVAPTLNSIGSYESVVYCSVCGKELSREKFTVPALTDAAAEIDGYKYATFEAALEAAEEGDTIKLLKEVVVTADTTLDLTGKKLDGNGVYPAIRVQNGATLTIKNGEFVNETDYLFTLGSSDKTQAGNLVIEAGSFKAQTTIASVTKGILTIKGGTFECFESSYGTTYMLNCYDETYRNNAAEIVVTGGTFVGFNPADNTAEGANTSFVAENYCCSETDGSWTVVEGHEAAAAVEENKVAATCTTDGSYDSVIYCSACGEKLSSTTVTVDALDHAWGEPTYTNNGENHIVTRICENDETHTDTKTEAHTYENGKCVCGAEQPITAKVVEVTDAEGNVTYYEGFKGFKDLALAGCTIKLLDNVSDANLILNKGDDAVLDLNGFTFSRTGSDSGAINLTQGAKLTIRDSSEAKTGKVIGDTHAVWITNGDLVIESGIIETTSTTMAAMYANAAEVAIEGGKIVSAGDAILVGANFMESRGTSTIEISGGEIEAAGYGIVNGGFAQEETSVAVSGGTITSGEADISFTTGTATVTGGTFSSDVSDYCAEGFKAVQNADGTYSIEEMPSGSVTIAFTSETGFWGEGGGNATESLVVSVYEGDKVIGTASLNNIGGILSGNVYVTWQMPFAGSNDEYWTVQWAEGYPNVNMAPTKVTMTIDGVEVAENVHQWNAADSLFPIVALTGEGSTLKAHTKLSGLTGTVYVLRDVTENISSFENVTLVARQNKTRAANGVTITSTYSDYVDFNNVTVKPGVTVKAAKFFSDGSVNVIEGTLDAGTLYNGYDAKTTVQNGGKIITTGMIVNRYHNNADSGIYVYGDGDDSTVEISCADTIGTYSGTFYAKDAVVEGNMLWIDYLKGSNQEPDSCAQSKPVFENSVVKITQELRLYKDATLTLTDSSVTAGTVQVRENATPVVAIDNSSSLKADAILNLTGANLNAVLGADGTVTFKITGLKGTGTEADPYQIGSVEELKFFRDEVNGGNTYQGKFVKLTADIDLNGEAWTPIGTSSASFNGIFDGNGKTISNLVIDGAGKSNIGFFGYTQNGEIKNLTINNAKVTGRLNVAVVAGTPYTSKYTNIKVTGHVEVNGMAYVGGVGGKNAYANWTDITVDVDSTSYVKADSVENGTGYRTYVGGVVGFNGEGGHTFKNISSNIKVLGNISDIGGLFGIAHYSNKFENVTFTGSVEAPAGAEEVGGIAGVWHNEKGYTVTFTDVTSTGSVTVGGETVTGSVVGGAYNAENETVDNSGSLIIDGKESWLKVAQIGENKFATLAEAIAAAQAGNEIVLLTDVAENVTLPAGVTFNGNGKAVNGTLTAGGDLTFKGHTKVTAFSAGYYNRTITIGEGASLTVNNRITVSYGNVFNITGSVADAKTADKTTITPSLNLIGGISYNGNGGGAQFNATNAYIILGDSSTKNNGATGEFYMNFDNCIVDYTKVLKTYMPTVSGLAPVFNFNAKDSVVNFASHLELWLKATTMTLDNTNMTVGGSFANAGVLNVENGSNFIVNAPIMSSHGGNTGTIAVKDASFELKDSNEDWQNAGTMTVDGNGNVTINDFKNTGDGELVIKSHNAAVISGVGRDDVTVTTDIEGYGVTYNETTKNYELVKLPVASVNGVGYATLEEAFKAATSGCTIEILQDVTIDYKWDCRYTGAKFTVPVTINGNGHTIKFTNTVYDGGNHMAAFRFEAAATVNNLTIDMSEALSGFAGRFRAISAKGDLTVDGCTFIGNGSANNTRAIIFGESAGANTANLAISITDSTFIDWRRGVSDNENAQDVKSVTVTGNTFEDASVFVSANETVVFTDNRVNGTAEVNIKSYTDEIDSVTVSGNELTNGAKGYVEDAKSYDNIQDEFVITAPVIITSGETVKYFNSLAAAVKAAQDGDIINLMPNVTISEGTIKLPATMKNVTFKGAEGAVLKNMTIMASDGSSIEYVGLTFDGITFDNSRIVLTGWRTGGAVIKDLTVTNSVFKNLNDNTNNAPVHINVAATEAVNGFTFTNNVIDGVTGGSKSGVYAQLTGKVEFANNIINNVSFRPYVIQLTTDDGIADKFIVTGNTFSGSAAGRAQGLGNNANGTDAVELIVSDNIFKDITVQQICYWNFNPETTTADLSKNYYDIDIQANPSKIYFNSAAVNAEDLIEMGAYPYYADEAKTQEVTAPAIMVTYADGTIEYFEDMRAAVPHTSNYPKLEDATITLLKDMSGLGMRFMENGMVFDLNGHTYTLTGGTGSKGTETSGFQIRPEVTETVTIKDGTIQVAEGVYIVWMFNNYANDFIVEDVTVDCTNMCWSYGESCYVVVSRSGDNVQFTGNTEIKNFKSDVAGHAILVGDTMTIGENVVPGGSIMLEAGATLTAPAGLDVYTDEGYKVVYANGVYGTAKIVAMIGQNSYESLADAIAAAQNGETVTLLTDCNEDVTVVQAPDKVITIDGNGKKMTGSITVDGKSAAYATAGLTIQNVNFVQDTPEQVFINLGVKGNNNTRYTSNVTVKDCTFTGTDKTACGIKSYTGGDKNLKITGCTATGMHSLAQLNNVTGVEISNVKITGGKNGISLNYSSDVVVKDTEIKVSGYGIRAQADSADIGDLTVSNTTIEANDPIVVRKATEDGYKIAVENSTLTGSNGNGYGIIFTEGDDGTYVTPNVNVELNVSGTENVFPAFTAKIGDKSYVTLAAAIEAAQNGEIVTILAGEYTTNLSVNKAITVVGETDADGKNLVKINGGISITANGAAIKNLTASNPATSGYNMTLSINAGDVLVEGCEITDANAIRFSKATGKVTFKDSIITGSTYGIHFDGAAGGEIVIDNCVITGWTSFAATINKVTISDTEFAEGYQNQLRFYQDVEMNNVVFNPKMTVDFGKNEVEATFNGCSVSDGSALIDVIYLPDIAQMGVEVKIDNEPVVVVALIGNTAYLNLADAFAAAKDGDEIKIYTAGTYALATSGKDITITGKVDGVVFDNIGAHNMGGANVTFNNVTFDYYPNVNYTGLQHSGNLVYNNCIINGQVFLYGQSETFNNCTFNQNSSDAYNVWTYGAKEVDFKNCTFNSAGKSVLIYSDQTSVTNDVTVTGCEFLASNAVEGKAAIEMDSSISGEIKLTIDGETTATGFGTGNVSGNSLWNNKKGNNTDANNDITVKVGDETVLAPVTFVAQVGSNKYASLAEAIEAAQDGETVTLLTDCNEDVTVVQAPDKAITIDGNGKKMTGSITVNGKSAAYATAGLTIQNMNFVQDTAEQVFINLGVKGNNNTRYTSNVTVTGCTFTGTDKTACGIKSYTGGDKNLKITGCTATGMHSLAQLNNVTGVEISNVKITGGKNGISLNYSSDVVVKDTEIKVSGYGIRAQADSADIGDLTVSNTTIEANDPIVVRKATEDGYKIAVENSTLTGSNGNGYGIIFTEGDDGTYVTPNVNVELNVSGTENVFPAFVAKIGTEHYVTLTAAIAAAQNGDTIVLLADVEATEVILIDKSLTINGNDHKVTSSASRVFRVTTSNVEVTMNKVNVVSTAVRVGSNDIRGISIDILENVKLTLNGSSLDFTDASACDWAYGVNIAGNGNGHVLTINGGSYEGANVINVHGANNTIIVKDAALNSLYGNNLYSGACIWVLQNQGSSVEVTGTTFNGENAVAFNVGTGTAVTESNNIDNTMYLVAKAGEGYYYTLAEAIANVQAGGTVVLFNSVEENISLNKSITLELFEGATNKGTFTLTDKAAALTCVEGLDVITSVADYKVTYADGAYKLIAKNYIAQIGTTQKFESLAEAVAAAKPGQTIKLIKSAEGPGVVIDKDLTINLNGKTYTITEGVGSAGTETNGFQIMKDTKVTIQAGTLKVADEAASKIAILVQNYGDLTVYNATLDGTNLDRSSTVSYALSINSGYVQLVGSSKIIANDRNLEGDYAIDLYDYSYAGYELPYLTIRTTVKVQGKINAAVKVSATEYAATLQQAVNKAGSGVTLKLLRDTEGAGVIIDKKITIDFSGHTYTLNKGVGSTGTESNGFQILAGNTVTLRNGTVKVADSAADKFYILVQNYADLTTYDLTLDGTNLDKWSKTDGDSYVLSNNSGKVKIGSGTKIIANNDGALAFAFDACDKSEWGYTLPVVTVDPTATITGNIEAAAKIGNVYYATLNQAIDAAANGKTITLVGDINLNNVDTVLLDNAYNTYFKVAGKTLTIDLNGKTISGAHTDTSNMLVGVFSTEDGGHLTLTGNGKVDLTEGEGATVYSLMSNYDRDCTITIVNGSYTLNSAKDCLLHSSCDKGLIIKGGNFELGNVGKGHWTANRGNGSPWIINVNGQNTGAAVVSGGTYNYDISNQHWIFEVDIQDGKGNLGVIVNNGDGTWTVTGKTAEVGIVNYSDGYEHLTGYATFQDAVASVAKGAPETTIKLLKNITVKGQFIGHSYAQKVVIDLNGYTMSSTDKTLTVYRGGTEVTIKNGTVSGNTTGGTIQVTYGGKLTLGENVTVKSGGQATALKVDANSTLIIDQESTYVLGGKNDLVVAEGATVEISAGYFKKAVKAEWCAPLCVPSGKQDNGYYTVLSGIVAKVGDSYFGSIQEAVNAAADGDTITVLFDHELLWDGETVIDGSMAAMVVVAEKSVTIDLNGKKLTVDGSKMNGTDLYAVFAADEGGSLTLTGKGTVEATGVGFNSGVTAYCLMMAYEAGTELVVENGTYTMESAHDSLVYTGGDECVTIKNGTYTLGNQGIGPNGKPWIFNGYGKNANEVVVRGGTFNADVNHQFWANEVDVLETLALKNNGNGTWTVVDAAAYVEEIGKSQASYRRKVGYATVAEAYAAAKNGQQVTILNNGEAVQPEIVETNEVTALDSALANGGNVSMTEDMTISTNDTTANSGYGKTGVKVNGGSFNGNGNTLNVPDANGTWGCAVNAVSGVIENVKITGAFRGIFMGGANGDVYINNVVLDGVTYTFNSDGGSKNYGVYVSNTTLYGWTSFSNVHKEVVFTDCTFGEGNGNAFCRPYNMVTVFRNCVFQEGFEFDTSKVSGIVFENCYYGETLITAENASGIAMFYNGLNGAVIK